MTFLGNARKGPKRLLVDVTDALHKEIKTRAMNRNISIKTWALQAFLERIAQEKMYEDKQS